MKKKEKINNNRMDSLEEIDYLITKQEAILTNRANVSGA